MTRTTFSRILICSLGLIVTLSVLVWTQTPAEAQEPEETGVPNLSIQIIPEGDGLGIAELGPSVFDVGDTFNVSIVALGVQEPGIFGSQFEIQYDTNFLSVEEGSLVPGSAMQPVVNPVKEIDAENGLIKFAASRQGDLENLAGDVVLATLSFTAIASTEPPEGQTTTIDLQNVKLGTKSAIEVPVSGIVDLDVIIRGVISPGPGDIVGNVKVEGRAADTQANHTITATGDLGGVLTEATEANGDFWINDAPADTYSLTANSAGFLAATCNGVVHTTDALTALLDVNLLAGDIDDNGAIDITDAVTIGNVFGSTTPGETADLNIDGVVDVFDLILMAVNYGQTSEGNAWVCQSSTEL